MTKRKKAALGVLGALVLAVAVACIVYVVRVPDLTIYFDSGKGDAFTMQTKTGVIQKIELPGYDKVSFVTPFDGGYYCRAEKGENDYFLLVQDGQVTGELAEPDYAETLYVDEMGAVADGLYAACSVGENLQKVLFADFANGQITELPLTDGRWQAYLATQGGTVLLGRGGESAPYICRWQNGRLQELVQGTAPVLLSETQFLYEDVYTEEHGSRLMLYDLATGEAKPAAQKVNFDLYSAGLGWSAAPFTPNGWLVGWRGGIPMYEATALLSGITVTNVDSGESYWLPTTLGRNASHLQAIANA